MSGRYIEGVGNGLGANHPYTIAHTHTHAHTYTYNRNTITHRGAEFENTRHRTDVQRALEAVGAGLPDQTRPRGGKLILV